MMSFGPGCGLSQAGGAESVGSEAQASDSAAVALERAKRLRLSIFRSPAFKEERDGPIGLALFGGGITGALFEVGVLAALDEVAGAPASTRFDVYIGASAGASVATPLAQGIPAARFFRALSDEGDDFFPLRREHVYFGGRA